MSDSQGAAEVISTIASAPSSKVGNNNANNTSSKLGWNDDLSGSKRRTEQVSLSSFVDNFCCSFVLTNINNWIVTDPTIYEQPCWDEFEAGTGWHGRSWWERMGKELVLESFSKKVSHKIFFYLSICYFFTGWMRHICSLRTTAVRNFACNISKDVCFPHIFLKGLCIYQK